MYLICRHGIALMSVLMFTLKLTRRRFSHLAFDPPGGQTYHDMLSFQTCKQNWPPKIGCSSLSLGMECLK